MRHEELGVQLVCDWRAGRANLVPCSGKMEQGKTEPGRNLEFGSIINKIDCEEFFLMSNRALQN